MHIITGLLLTALLGGSRREKRRRGRSVPGVIETVHSISGRLRVRVPSLTGRHEVGAALAAQIGRLEGVESSEFSPISGSILVRYRPDVVEPDMLFAGVVRLGGLERAIEQPRQCRIRSEIETAGESVNRAVFEKTGGMLDLWTALPLVFLVIGIRKLIGGKTANPQTGMMLLWWAYLSLFPPGGRGASQ